MPPGTMSEGPYSTTDEIAQRAQDALAQRAQDTGRPRTAGCWARAVWGGSARWWVQHGCGAD